MESEGKNTSDEELNNYKCFLEILLEYTYLPDYVINCNNFLFKDNYYFISEMN